MRPGPAERPFAREPERVDALRFGEVDRRAWLPEEPDRERDDFDLLVEDFVLRDRGEEDVRVAMVARLCADHISLSRHTPTPHHQSPCAGPTSRTGPVRQEVPKSRTGQASRTVGMIIGLRRSLPETKPPTVRRMTC